MGDPEQGDGRKIFLRKVNVPLAPWAVVRTSEDLAAALSSVGAPAVLKTAAFGYDGKGQAKVSSKDEWEAEAAWAASAGRPASSRPSSISSGRFRSSRRAASTARSRSSPSFENEHSRHILDVTRCPAPLSPFEEKQSREIARAILDALSYVGVLCIEMFHTPPAASS